MGDSVFFQDIAQGAILINRTSGFAFTRAEEHLARQVMALLSLRLERNRLIQSTDQHLKEAQETARHYALLNDMHVELETVESEEELYQLTRKWVREILGSDNESIAVFDLRNNRVTLSYQENSENASSFRKVFPLDSTSYVRLMVERRVISTQFDAKNKYYDHLFLSHQFNAQSFISTPLIVSGVFYGAIDAISENPNAFGKTVEGLLLQVAAFVALKIENLKREKEFERHAQDLQKLNGQLNVTIHNLNDRETELSHALESNKELLSITSHDLKNPIGGIIGLSDLVIQDLPTLQGSNYGEVSENIHLIKQEAEHVLNLIENILDKHRLETKHTFQIKRTDIHALIQEIIDWNYSQAIAKEITFHFEPEGNPYFSVDYHSFQRALDNYISNAVKYSPKGANVWIKVNPNAHNGSYWQLSVRDEGPGLNEADKQLVFRKMQRLSAQPTAGEHSTGLGLYIVKQIIEQHGGTVGVDSVYGEGATFWMLLPHISQLVDKINQESAIQA